MSSSIWFNDSTKDWEEGLPIGNGRLGAMILGNVVEDQIFLNEETIWYGGDKDRHNDSAIKHLEEVRQLLFEGQIEKAQQMCKVSLGSNPQYINPYLPGGYIGLYMPKEHSKYIGYKRQLDLEQGIVSISYQLQDKLYKREMLSSYPDQVMAMHLTTTDPSGLSFSLNINRRPYDGIIKVVNDRTLLMTCECGKEGIEFATAIGVESEQGNIQVIGDYLVVSKTMQATIYIATETTYEPKDYIEVALKRIQKAREKGYQQIKESHIQDYKKLFNRSSIVLGDERAKRGDKPTDQLLQMYREGIEDTELIELFYNYGKYLMIASSRAGGLPSNLQGIWNMSYTPAWESNYTININTQMNYWAAEVNNLASCHEPLLAFIERLCEKGKETARVLYGCNGSVAHHASNLWADSAPVGIFDASPYWPMGLAWLSLHMHEHFLYNGDQDFLRDRCYPVLKEVAIFFADYMTMSPEGYLVTGPSVSPENTYISQRGEVGALCMGPSMDIQIIKEVFKALKNCFKTLEIKDELETKMDQIQDKLPPIAIGSKGQIMEWYQELEEVEAGHRHISHLFALHPGSQITEATPEWFQGAEVTLRRRIENGGGHTGWSRAWIVNFYARLLKGEEAYLNLRGLLTKSVKISLLDIHPPFQIDGNFGGCAAIAEMLLQSHEEMIRILPACPKVWQQQGEVRGLVARGGFEISFRWEKGIVKTLSIYSKCGNLLKLKGIENINDIKSGAEEKVDYQLEEKIIIFQTQKNQTYYLNS